MQNLDSGYAETLIDILEGSRFKLADLLPSVWAEQNRRMTSDVSPLPGPFSYDNSPYTREIIDCLSPSHPARVISVMKGSQIGFSTSVIENGIGWIISQEPGNILFLVGHSDLVKDAGTKIDRMIDNSGIRHLIKSSSGRARNTKSGDTDSQKEYAGGYLKMGAANHKVLRNISMQYGFIDDYESMKGESKESGSTEKMIDQRFKAFAKKKKIMYISTPELKETSNIEPMFEKGDQRKYHIPCPCCGSYIVFEWNIECKIEGIDRAGIVWQEDEVGNLVEGSVGYICQDCGGFFDDSNKTELILAGRWEPTAEPSRPGYYSYHISSLYSPVYMSSWEDYVRDFKEANPPDGVRDEAKWKVFANQVLGETYEQVSESISANALQNNIREYNIGIIPEKQSLADGNGRIVMLTLGSDLNGKDDSYKNHDEDDARLDWEILAHSESGATYSVNHGSIGTFKSGDKSDRVKWTYKHGAPNSVWPELQKIIRTIYSTDTGRKMALMCSTVDCGAYTNYAYTFIDNANGIIFGVKGKDMDTFMSQNKDIALFKKARERNNLYLVEVNEAKDRLAQKMRLRWNPKYHDVQPSGFMNFPLPSDGKYLYQNYFAHFEAEHKVIDENGRFRWVKKNSAVQNHLFDCRIYAEIAKEILIDQLFKELKIKDGVWQDYVDIVLKRRKK